jgi:rod shape-determining protein MreD
LKIFLIILTIIFNLIIQSTILPYFEIFGVVPNTALIIVVVLALAKGKYYGGVFGLIIGLLQDVIFSVTIGVNGFIYFFVGYLIGFVEDTFARDNIVNPIILTALATIFYNIVYSLFLFFLSINISYISAVKSVFSLEVIYNSIVSIIIYKLFQVIFSEPKIRFRKR